MTQSKQIFLLLFALVLAVAAAGCGDSGSSSSAGPANPGSDQTQSPSGSPFKGEPRIVKFGQPAPADEVAAASKILAENLEAREEADFAAQCASLTSAAQGEVVGSETPKTAQECPEKLEELAKPLRQTEEIRTNTFDGSIDELRKKGANAYALYHGNDGNNYAMPMLEEGGTWKVGSIVTTQIE